MIRNASYLLLLLMSSLFAGCQVIGGIFKAGVWTGILMVVVIIVVIILIIRGVSKKS